MGGAFGKARACRLVSRLSPRLGSLFLLISGMLAWFCWIVGGYCGELVIGVWWDDIHEAIVNGMLISCVLRQGFFGMI